MKHLLFLSLWAAGVLGSRCRPSNPPVESSLYGVPGSSSSKFASQSGTSGVDSTSGVATSAENSGYYPPPGSSSSWSGSQSVASESTSWLSGSAPGTLSLSLSLTSSSETAWLPGHTPGSEPAPTPSFDSSSLPGNSHELSSTSTFVVPGSENTPQSQTTPPSGTASGSETHSGPPGTLSEGASTQFTSAQATPQHPGASGPATISGTTGVPVNTQSVPSGSASLSEGIPSTQPGGSSNTTPGQSGHTDTTVQNGSPSSLDDTTTAGPSGPVSASESGVRSQSGLASSGQPGNNTPGATHSSNAPPGNTLPGTASFSVIESGNTVPGNAPGSTAVSGSATLSEGNSATVPSDSATVPSGSINTSETGLSSQSGTASSGQSENTVPRNTQTLNTQSGATSSGPAQASTTASAPFTLSEGSTETASSGLVETSNAGSTFQSGESSSQKPVSASSEQLSSADASTTQIAPPGSTASSGDTSVPASSNSGSASGSGSNIESVPVSTGQPSNTDAISLTGSAGPSNGVSATSTAPPQTTGTDGPISTSPATSTQTEGQSLTSTMTEPPAGFSPTTVSNHPEWTTNTWITTTSSGSSEPTIVPVLVGCPLCGGSGSGIVIFGFPPFINTLFSFPGFPKFSFPCIPPGCSSPPKTEGEPDDGDDSSKSDEASTVTSSTCTEEVTASDCLVACTTFTGPAEASLTPECTTTCTKTHTGCSVTGVTSTTSAEACSATGDRACDYCGVVSTTPDAESLERRELDRRSKADPKSVIGGCNVKTPPKFPEYPGGGTVLANDALIVAGTPLYVIERWWMTTRTGCVPTLKGPEPASQYHANINLPENVPSIDHVFEKSWLTDFFNAIIDSTSKSNVHGFVLGSGTPPTKLTCDDLQYYTDDLTGTTLLQNIFDTYPGAKSNPKNKIMVKGAKYLEDFLGMDQWTNGDAKGFTGTPLQVASDVTTHTDPAKTVTATTSYKDAKNWVDKKLTILERLGIGIEMMAHPSAIAAMIRQNQRIYSRLVDLDTNARTCKSDPAVSNGLWSFAAEYQTFMNNRFAGTTDQSINYVVGNAKTTLITQLTADLVAAASNTNVPAGALQVWKDRLANMQDPNRKWEVVLTWDWTFVTKRDEPGSSDDSCPLPSQTLTTLSTVVSKSQTAESQTESATNSDSISTSDSDTGTLSATGTATRTTATTASSSASATSVLTFCSSDDDCKAIDCETPDEVAGCTSWPAELNIDNFCVCSSTATTTTSEPPTTSPTQECDYYPPFLSNGTVGIPEVAWKEACRCNFDGTKFTREEEQSAIDKFCDGSTVKTIRHGGPKGGVSGTYPIDGDKKLTVSTGFYWSQSCGQMEDFKLDDYCHTALSVLTSCNAAGSDDETYGGSYVDDSGRGCIYWQLEVENS